MLNNKIKWYMENAKKLKASIKKHEVTPDDIASFVKTSVVKFIFLDKNYSEISSDENVYEIHKFKSVYRGNTNIRVPFEFKKATIDGADYFVGIEVTKSDNPIGYAVISKLDLINISKSMKKAKKQERIAFGEKICYDYIELFNGYLSNKIWDITVTDDENNVVKSFSVYAESLTEGEDIDYDTIKMAFDLKICKGVEIE